MTAPPPHGGDRPHIRGGITREAGGSFCSAVSSGGSGVRGNVLVLTHSVVAISRGLPDLQNPFWGDPYKSWQSLLLTTAFRLALHSGAVLHPIPKAPLVAFGVPPSLSYPKSRASTTLSKPVEPVGYRG